MLTKYQVGEIVTFRDRKGRVVEARKNDKGYGVVREEMNRRCGSNQWVSNLDTGGKGSPDDGGEMYLLDDLHSQYVVDLITQNTEFYQAFMENVEVIGTLASITLPNQQAQNTLYRLLFFNTVVALETYLSDAFINTVTNDDSLKRKLLETDPKFKKRKFVYAELYTQIDNVHETITDYLLNIIYHNIWKVKELYKDVLNVSFPEDMNDIQKAIKIRHDIAHRSGKSKSGEVHQLGHESVSRNLQVIKTFVKNIDGQLNTTT